MLKENTHNRFTALFPGLLGWASARRNLLLDFMVQRRISEADTLKIRLGVTPSLLISDPPPLSPHFFTLDALHCNGIVLPKSIKYRHVYFHNIRFWIMTDRVFTNSNVSILQSLLYSVQNTTTHSCTGWLQIDLWKRLKFV